MRELRITPEEAAQLNQDASEPILDENGVATTCEQLRIKYIRELRNRQTDAGR